MERQHRLVDLGVLLAIEVGRPEEVRHAKDGIGVSCLFPGATRTALVPLPEDDPKQRRPDITRAVISRGGRPDLAGPALERVSAPTLLLVGALDEAVIAYNEDALKQLRCEKHMQLIPGATHLFEEFGTLEEVAHLASEWFVKHLLRPRDD